MHNEQLSPNTHKIASLQSCVSTPTAPQDVYNTYRPEEAVMTSNLNAESLHSVMVYLPSECKSCSPTSAWESAWCWMVRSLMGQ